MLDSIDVMCRTWGPVHKRILLGERDERAWPRRSLLGRIRDEGVLVSSGPTQQFASVYAGGSLLVQAAIREPWPAPFPIYATLVVHYVLACGVKVKPIELAALLELQDLAYRDYWKLLDRAHHFVSGRIRRPLPASDFAPAPRARDRSARDAAP